MSNYISFEEWENEQLTDAEFREAAERLEPSYQISRLRIMRGFTQEQLAKKIGTKQSGIARLESGKKEPSISFLRKIVEALNAILIIQIIPQEELSFGSQLSIGTTNVMDTMIPTQKQLPNLIPTFSEEIVAGSSLDTVRQ